MTTRDVRLAAQIRGAPFEYSTALEGGWTFEQFNGGMFFAVRRKVPPGTTVSDADAIGRTSTALGGITGSGVNVAVSIPSSVTQFWPVEELVWELRGVINGSPKKVHPIAMGVLPMVGDVSRSS